MMMARSSGGGGGGFFFVYDLLIGNCANAATRKPKCIGIEVLSVAVQRNEPFLNKFLLAP